MELLTQTLIIINKRLTVTLIIAITKKEQKIKSTIRLEPIMTETKMHYRVS